MFNVKVQMHKASLQDESTHLRSITKIGLKLITAFTPERKVVVTELDPEFVTREIESLLRKRNRRM